MWRLSLLLVGCLTGCELTPPSAAAEPPPGARGPSTAAPVRRPPAPTPARSASPSPSRRVAPPPASSAPRDPPHEAGAAPVEAADNRVAPLTVDPSLAARAQAVFAALERGDAAAADALYFPRAPFLALKGGKNPARYYKYLLDVYHADLAKVARRHALWSRTRLLGLDVAATPVWVEPGQESNALGYYKLRGAALRYELNGEPFEIVIDTMITWQGRWYITHLAPVKR